MSNSESNDLIPKISVVIPVKNEIAHISACLEGILSQTVPVLEIIVIDSGSTDGTQDVASGFPKVRVIDILPEDFNHGDTRNLGVQHAAGEYVLFTVGDAKPVNNYWIETLLSGFSDASVAGVCGLQVVEHSKETNPAEWFRPVNKDPKTISYSFESTEDFETSSAEKRRNACGWDDVTAMYRRDVLCEIPFRIIVYGEDLYWAIDALTSGHTLVYNPLAQVYHFHKNNFNTTFKRTIAVSYLRHVSLGVLPPRFRPVLSLARAIRALMREQKLTVFEKMHWANYNFLCITAIWLGGRMFTRAQRKSGNKDIDVLHRKYCGSPPIPLKKAV